MMGNQSLENNIAFSFISKHCMRVILIFDILKNCYVVTVTTESLLYVLYVLTNGIQHIVIDIPIDMNHIHQLFLSLPNKKNNKRYYHNFRLVDVVVQFAIHSSRSLKSLAQMEAQLAGMLPE